MKVSWTETYWPRSIEDMSADYIPPTTLYIGDVIGCVRAFGETRLVVMLTTGSCREVKISEVRKVNA